MEQQLIEETNPVYEAYLARKAARPKGVKMSKFLRVRAQEFLTANQTVKPESN